MTGVRSVRGLPQPGRTLVVGVVNVTPDSFSDGGEWFDHDEAIRHGYDLLEQGADVVDVGGESTRPGAVRPTQEEELRRVLPVVEALTAAGAVVSVDTMRPEVAERAVASGARCVNDVSGGRADERMIATVAGLGVPYVCMHWRGHSVDMQRRAHYDDVAAEVVAELRGQVERCLTAGIAEDQLVVDPGIGFAKNAEHNWALSAHLDVLVGLGYPVLFAASRKTYLGRLLAGPDGAPRPVEDREAATLATSILAVAAGAWGVRVHDVTATADALAVWRATGSPRLRTVSANEKE
jgi:dihydropteroate synthase